MAKPQGTKVIADNRRARHDYTLLERVEAGIQLVGTEVKSLRVNGASLAQAHAEERGGELWLVGAHIAPYEKSGACAATSPSATASCSCTGVRSTGSPDACASAA